jgi:hypothetical protein
MWWPARLPCVAHATDDRVNWRREVPEAIRGFDTIASPDYADVATAKVSRSMPPEAWFRAMLAGIPSPLLRFIALVQQSVLGARLGPPDSPDYMFGWKIADRGEDWLRLEMASSLLTGHVVLKVDDRQLHFATFVRYAQPRAALVWPPVSLIHRQAVLGLMHSAVRVDRSVEASRG